MEQKDLALQANKLNYYSKHKHINVTRHSCYFEQLTS